MFTCISVPRGDKHMFKDLDKNLKMVKGAYRKLKSYYFYNKNFVLLREKIADFESDTKRMEKTFLILSNLLCHPKTITNKAYYKSLTERIDFYVLPKKFENTNFSINSPVSNTIQRDKKMKTVNFFIDAPIEIHILDTLWTVFAAKIDKEKRILSFDVYGNTINKSALFPENQEPMYESRVLFNRYFNYYTAWRNNAFSALEKNYDEGHDSLLISLDLKSYYYSVAFNFSKMGDYFFDHRIIKDINPLTQLIKQVYISYYNLILPYRKDLGHLRKNEYPLPIGLFSSMVLGNIYLANFDKLIKKQEDIKYYGRYVDDLLLVVNKSINDTKKVAEILDDIFVKSGILVKGKKDYSIKGLESLKIQENKVKIIYIDHNESRAIIDTYNNTIKIIPSQMEPVQPPGLSLSSLDETVYSIENFNREHKIRDIGLLGINSFKLGRFFSNLPFRYNSVDTSEEGISTEIENHIVQVTHFFTGSQAIEYYSNWLNYMYFLVISQKNKQLRAFVSSNKKLIKELKATSLDDKIYKKKISICRRAKDTLLKHLDICLYVSLSIDLQLANDHYPSDLPSVLPYVNSNMFEHSFVALPLANYLEYNNVVSYNKMRFDELGGFPRKLSTAFKFEWSPRFIHFDELMLLVFYYYHFNPSSSQFIKKMNNIIRTFSRINHMRYDPFSISARFVSFYKEYVLSRISIPQQKRSIPEEIGIAVGSVNISLEKCLPLDGNKHTTIKDNEIFWDILRDTYRCFSEHRAKSAPLLLVLPELYFPIYWINDLIRFVKRAQIGVVTGLQYLGDTTNRKYNYLATILPFKSGSKDYKNAFVSIREKNDYSPLEIKALAKNNLCCNNKEKAEYAVFEWNGIRLSSLVCFELTDIMARAILKGNCDLIAASVFNRDTTYFSNIIDSSVRDLHAFIVQANTSHLGDSRVTGPYDRDSKDIFKIKGGENDHVVIGTVKFKELKDYQSTYDPTNKNESNSKPKIKPLPARFKNKP